MSIKDCIDAAVAGGEMDAARAGEAKRLIDDIEAEYLDELGLEGARVRAEFEAIDRLKKERAEKRRQTLIAIAKANEIEFGLRRTVEMNGLEDMAEIADATIDATGMPGVQLRGAEQERKAILRRAHSRLNEVLATFRRNLVGNSREKATLLNLVREVFGERTGDANAGELAKAWYETAEFLRRKFNEAGGHIARLDRWGLPQSHDVVKIRSETFEAWRDFILPKLDMARMIDGATGRPFSAEKMEIELRKVWETLRTDGMAKVRPGGQAVGRAIGNRRADHRFLHFKTADDWMAYQDRFGEADVFSAMMGHIEGMARDIGAMRALGPNPQAMILRLQTMVRAQASKATGEPKAIARRVNRAGAAAERLQVLYDHYTGSVNSPANGRAARWFSGVRSFLTSVQLGSAAISALTDLNFGRLAARHAGLDQARLMRRHFQLLKPRNLEDQKLAVRLGLIAENWSQVASAQMRYVGEVSGPEVMKRMSDFVLRTTGLSAWTQAGKWAFGMEFMGTLADHAGRAFDDLPAPLKKTLDNYRIDAGSWDEIRRTEIYEPDAGGFLRPDDIAARTDLSPERADELATRVLAMIDSETEFAVPSASLRGRATFGGNTKPGTVPGEILRSTLMYKNFAITLYFTHLRRMAQQNGAYNKARYGASLFVSTTLMGAFALQLKEISKGRDPRQMFGDKKEEFWIAALLQGGGLGIFGDFAFSDVNRFGNGFENTVAGPVVSFATDAWRLSGGNFRELMEGKDKTNFGAELSRFVGRYTPGASAWYARAAFERMIVDQLQLAVDPDARKRFRRQERKMQRDMGTRFFWPRGRMTPERPPDIGNALGG